MQLKDTYTFIIFLKIFIELIFVIISNYIGGTRIRFPYHNCYNITMIVLVYTKVVL